MTPSAPFPFKPAAGSAAPFGGPFDAGAALGGSFLGGGSPNQGIAVGASGTFVFSVSAADAASLGAADFASGPFAFDFIVRFKGMDGGASDKVPGVFVEDDDSDGDGTPDAEDGCPNDASKVVPGGCGCGVADLDGDGDGALDCIDGCPNDPAKTEPGQCGCGVADAGPGWISVGGHFSTWTLVMKAFDEPWSGGPALYAGEWGTGLMRWDGSAWSSLGGGGMDVWALESFDDGSGAGTTLFVAGSFDEVDGVATPGIARWNGTSWSAVGGGFNSGASVYALAVFDDGQGGGPALYAGGSLFLGSLESNLARWDGTSWTPVGGGVFGVVKSLCAIDAGSPGGPALVVGGSFTEVGNSGFEGAGVPANSIAKWDGISWSAFGTGMNSEVLALTMFDDGSGSGPALVAGGTFTTAGDLPALSVAKWDGTTWSQFGAGVDCGTSLLTVLDDGTGAGPSLISGGCFPSEEGTEGYNILARWDGDSWVPYPTFIGGGRVWTATVWDDGSGSGPALHVGGDFLASPGGWDQAFMGPARLGALCFTEGAP